MKFVYIFCLIFTHLWGKIVIVFVCCSYVWVFLFFVNLSRKEQIAEQREYKKKKAQKKILRMKELEQEREEQKSKWQQFNNKAYSKTKKGQVNFIIQYLLNDGSVVMMQTWRQWSYHRCPFASFTATILYWILTKQFCLNCELMY